MQARNPLPTGFAERVSFYTNKMQDLVGLAQQRIGTDAKVESAAEAKFGDGKPRGCSLPGSGDEIRRLHKHALDFCGTIVAEIDVVELCREGLATLPANACWRDVLVMFAHSKRRAGSMIGLGDGPAAIGNPSAPGVGVQHRLCQSGMTHGQYIVSRGNTRPAVTDGIRARNIRKALA